MYLARSLVEAVANPKSCSLPYERTGEKANLEVTNRELTCTSDIVKVFKLLQPEQNLDLVDVSFVALIEHRIDVHYHPLSICRPVCRHIFTDWLEIFPGVVGGLADFR